VRGASVGMTMTARTRASRAARATVCAVLPEENATAPRALVLRERENLVRRAAHLERARALKVLALEEDAPAGHLVERARVRDRRPVHERAYARLRDAYEIECQHRRSDG